MICLPARFLVSDFDENSTHRPRGRFDAEERRQRRRNVHRVNPTIDGCGFQSGPGKNDRHVGVVIPGRSVVAATVSPSMSLMNQFGSNTT